jgi:hypothetical protein
MRRAGVMVAGVLGSMMLPVTGGAQLSMDPAQWYINNQIYSTRVFNSTIGT